jgi:hypothetical protein
MAAEWPGSISDRRSSEIQVTIAGGLGETDEVARVQPSPRPAETVQRHARLGGWSQGNNLNDTLRSYGLTDVPA